MIVEEQVELAYFCKGVFKFLYRNRVPGEVEFVSQCLTYAPCLDAGKGTWVAEKFGHWVAENLAKATELQASAVSSAIAEFASEDPNETLDLEMMIYYQQVYGG